MKEFVPKVNMSLDAHYVTQSNVYACPILGPLTDRNSKYHKQKHPKVVRRRENRLAELRKLIADLL